MNKEQMRIAIATHLFPQYPVFQHNGQWRHEYPEGRSGPVYNYPDDLNAMHDVELNLPDDNSLHGLVVYHNKLLAVCGSHKACVSASAEQRAEAFLKTIDKWVEDAKVAT